MMMYHSITYSHPGLSDPAIMPAYLSRIAALSYLMTILLSHWARKSVDYDQRVGSTDSSQRAAIDNPSLNPCTDWNTGFC